MSDCIEWTGSVDRDGYGRRFTRKGSYPAPLKGIRVHREAWEKVHGSIPPGMIVMHICDNPPCINVEHLRLGTIADNNRDRAEKGRSFRGCYPTWLHKSGEEHSQAKLTSVQVEEIRARLAAGGPRGFQNRLASEFGVTPATITLIKQRKLWRGGA